MLTFWACFLVAALSTVLGGYTFYVARYKFQIEGQASDSFVLWGSIYLILAGWLPLSMWTPYKEIVAVFAAVFLAIACWAFWTARKKALEADTQIEAMEALCPFREVCPIAQEKYGISKKEDLTDTEGYPI